MVELVPLVSADEMEGLEAQDLTGEMATMDVLVLPVGMVPAGLMVTLELMDVKEELVEQDEMERMASMEELEQLVSTVVMVETVHRA